MPALVRIALPFSARQTVERGTPKALAIDAWLKGRSRNTSKVEKKSCCASKMQRAILAMQALI
jgi:hypothetical protein